MHAQANDGHPELWRRIKWSYATHVLRDVPASEESLDLALAPLEPPRAGDVAVAEVLEIGRHRRIEVTSKRATALFAGDLVGVVYGNRYATLQYEGAIPAGSETCHLLSVGGVCGEVVGMANRMEPPTLLRPLVYLTERSSRRVSLARHGLPRLAHQVPRPETILVVGSSMDSGKTTTAASIVNGLVRAGVRVSAGKVTGTASAKDLLLMEDAGACAALDFTDAGYASTALCSREQLLDIFEILTSQLAAHCPDYTVLEVADGITQRETRMLLEIIGSRQLVDHVIYACSDCVSVAAGIRILRRYPLRVAGVSGRVTMSPQMAQEARAEVDVPVLGLEELRSPRMLELFREREARPQREVTPRVSSPVSAR